MAESQEPTKVLTNLPEELWYEIIKQTSVISGVAEFATKAEQYVEIYTGDSTAIVNHEQLRVALGCRLRMVLICRAWAAIALPILWSHLRIPLQCLEGVLETLRLKPQLGLCVQRISTMEQHLHRAMLLQKFQEDDLLQEILHLCPHVTAIQTPVFNQDISHSLRNLHLLWYFPRNFRLPQGLTSLTVELIGQPQWITSLPPLQLPALRMLDIHRLTLYETWVSGIVEHWDFPSLQVLIITGGDAPRVVSLLRKFAPTLSAVKIYGHLRLIMWSDEPLRLERLNRLDIIPSFSTIDSLNKILHLPNLRSLLVFTPYERDIPLFETEKVANVQVFCRFLRPLHTWCPKSAVIAFDGVFVEWLARQQTVIDAFVEMRHEGRIVMPEAGLQPLDLS